MLLRWHIDFDYAIDGSNFPWNLWIHNLIPNTIEPVHQIIYFFISGSRALNFASSLTVPFNKSKKKTHKIYLPCCNWNLSQKYNIFNIFFFI